MDVVYSVNAVPIRMTMERWFHITENHDYLAGYYDDILETVGNPDLILRGYGGALIALRGIAKQRYLAVVYKLYFRSFYVLAVLSVLIPVSRTYISSEKVNIT